MFIQMLLILSWSIGLAHAEWEEVGTRPISGGYTIYADPTTHRIDQQSGLVKIWTLSDYTSPQKGLSKSPHLSVKTLLQFDCKEERARMVVIQYFEGNKAQGNIVYDRSAEGTWEPVAPGTIAEHVWKFACGTAKP